MSLEAKANRYSSRLIAQGRYQPIGSTATVREPLMGPLGPRHGL